ncbi:UvrD-helicase domain-containing protein [Suttonella ornithocola]|uniref:RecBCD enzyme subunit RecB n=1 Tax=Suttonella ornithocola TaxID=279832 RepID=A0A380MW67_9GAMM|nr:UvrD-helicase domain-containing protein [Suttonella ornithocola]SUO96296.1 Exodeoxyribonuclease V beta chain [Suttonella ornithocola]
MSQISNIPAIELPLAGKALIEASAGTGKTWTLTGILLRLLLEDDGEDERLPREIIATTFTRKAAAEMRRRIQLRFDAFLLLVREIGKAYQEDNNLLIDDEALGIRMDALLNCWVEEHHNDALKSAAGDAINRHILLQSCQKGLAALIALFERVERRSRDIDEIFIGTLDSLCQRWLSEYALETGSDNQLTLLENENQPVYELVHNHFRKFYHEHADEILQLKSFPSIENYSAAIAATMNFSEAEIENIQDALDEDKKKQVTIQQTLAAYNTEDFSKFVRELVSIFPYLANRGRLAIIKTQGITHLAQALEHLSHQKALSSVLQEALLDLVAIYEKASAVNNSGKQLFLALNQQGLGAAIQRLIEQYGQLFPTEEEKAKLFQMQMAYSALKAVRKKYPYYLAQHYQTTFSAQLNRLNQALSNEAGQALAQYIVHRYPILLVDESQDLNHAQANLLRHLFLNEHTKPSKAFLLLVGDPKQAIYLFRGGDVNNYLNLKSLFSTEEIFSLTTNFRSTPTLISAVNNLYLADEQSQQLGENIAYEKMQAQPLAQSVVKLADGSEIIQPIQWFSVEKAERETDQVVTLIKSLLNAKSQYAIEQKNGELAQLAPENILVLMRTRAKLAELQSVLRNHGIDAEFAADENIFQYPIAEEIGVLLLAMEMPQNRGRQNRLLSGLFFGKTVKELAEMAHENHSLNNGDALTYEKLTIVLSEASKMWEKNQLLAALQYFLTLPLDGKSVWQRLASLPMPDRDRHLLDLRQLLQIIAEQSKSRQPKNFLRWWQMALAEPPAYQWAIATALPGKSAIRLMTIHGAKGLEAPVVILADMGQPTNHSEQVYSYLDEGERKLSTIPPKGNRAEQKKQETSEEQARLLYVAITRAANLLFVGLRQKTRNIALEKLGMKKDSKAQFKEEQFPKKHLFLSEISEEILLRQDDFLLPEPVGATNSKFIQSFPYPKQTFKGWQKTSFTGLSRTAMQMYSAVDIELPDYMSLLEEPTELESLIELPIALRFPKGVRAGSFLHKVLEDATPDFPYGWEGLIKRHAPRFGLYELLEDEQSLKETANWLKEVSQSTLISGATLFTIPIQQQIHEMNFSLSVNSEKPLDIVAINQLLQKWGKNVQLLENRTLIGFLRGEIDLCYQYNDKYYILDYKSNYLGDESEDYSQANMSKAMNDHHYWLQALIYQTALHRWLSLRLPNYAPNKHLADVEYFFLRGCPTASSKGHLSVNIPTEILLSFDELLKG